MRYKELLTTSRKGGLNGRYRKKNGRVLAGSTSIGPICILHDEDDLNVGDGDPYIPGKQSRKGLALTPSPQRASSHRQRYLERSRHGQRRAPPPISSHSWVLSITWRRTTSSPLSPTNHWYSPVSRERMSLLDGKRNTMMHSK